LLARYYAQKSERQQRLSRAKKAIDALRQQSEQNGNAEMTLEDINEEIRQTRIERKSKKTVAQY
jgi:anti-sigma factor RsiW